MGTITPFPGPGRRDGQVGFERTELMRILDLYGRMVAAGHWRDYAMNFDRDAASFSAFRRTAERPARRWDCAQDPAYGVALLGPGIARPAPRASSGTILRRNAAVGMRVDRP